MRKLLLCALVIITSACSSNDDSNSGSDQDLIIGVWKPVADGEVFDGVPDDYTYNDCEQQSRYTFSANGDFESFDYTDTDPEGCYIYNTSTGTWLRLNYNRIKFTFDGEVSIPDRTRFLDNNTFRIEWDDGDYVEFKRVN